MGKVAFVFSGQGDQFPGMGKSLYDEYEEARRMFRLFDQIRPGTSDQCFSGTPEELKDTKNTQPCLFAMELAAAEVLKAHNILPDAVAGFSLGEVSACTFAGAFSEEQGFRLIIRRGELMGEAAGQQPSFMAAVLRLDEEKVKEICHSVKGVYAVNFNCPGQITVSGHELQKELFEERVLSQGGRMIPLKVGGAFHSPFMETAAGHFRSELDRIPVKNPDIPVYSNVTALPYQGELRDLLARQIMSPVYWEATVKNMIRAGVDTFAEIGPGSTLSGLIRRIDRSVRTYTISDLPKILQEVRVC